MRTWIAALAAVAVMAGAAVAHNHSDLQRELDQVKAQLEAVQGRLAEMERAEGGSTGLAAAMRQDLEALGGKVGIFDVSAAATVVVQHGIDVNKSGGRRNYPTLESVVGSQATTVIPVDIQTDRNSRADIAMCLGFGLAANLTPESTVFMSIKADQGDAVEHQTGTLAGVNRIARERGSRLTLDELWYRHSFEDGMVDVTVGKIDFTLLFDGNAAAGDKQTQFLSPALVHNMTIDFPVGYNESPGVVARLNQDGPAPVNNWYVMGGVADANADFRDFYKEMFGILEAGAEVEFVDGFPGTYRIYVWRNNSDHVNIRRMNQDRTKDGMGWGLSLDQRVDANMIVFLRWGMRDRDAYVVNRALSYGMLVEGELWGRADDAVGLAANLAMLSGHARRLARTPPQNVGTGNELLAEAFYRCQINDYLAVSPNIQFVKNPGGLTTFRHDMWVLGMRARLQF